MMTTKDHLDKKPRIDLTGQTFGYLTVIRYEGIKVYGTKNKKFGSWICKCKCGKETTGTTGKLRYGHKTSCGCRPRENLDHKKNSLHHGWKGFKTLSGTLWNRIKYHAKQRDIEFNITIEQAQNLIEKQDYKCAISGVPIYLAQTQEEIKTLKNTASLDRIDSNKGYTIDNIQWVHKMVNDIKSYYSQQDFVNMCCQIAKFQAEKNIDMLTESSFK